MDAAGRSTGGRFIMLPDYMTSSPAWETLSPNALKLLLAVWKRHNGTNNGDISFSVREAETIGLSKDQTSRGFQELTDRGFLKVRRASTFNLKTKEARTWEITAEKVGDAPASKDFMRWRPEPQSHQRDCEGSEKNKTQSHQRDAQSHQRDSKAPDATRLPSSVAPARPSTPKEAPAQSHQRDTYNLPPGERPDERTAVTTTSSAAEHDQQPIHSGRAAAHRQRPDQPAGIERDPRQVDLEDLLQGKAIGAAAPVDRLRADLIAHVDRAPKGETKRIAAKLGLSGPQISNFKAGRFGLNPTAAAMLRQLLDTQGTTP